MSNVEQKSITLFESVVIETFRLLSDTPGRTKFCDGE
jgi:hypothetical protein